jgi:hypothetical protein
VIEPTDEMRMVAYRDAREWAAVHGHQQPDDRMIDDVVAAVLAIVERDRSDEPGLTRAANAARRIADRFDEQAKGKTGAERIEKLSQAIGARLVAIRLIELADAEGKS